MIVATLPTWNESGNIRPLIEELLALRDDLHVLVIDDNSPDGTWRIVGEMAAGNPRVHLLHRTTMKGRGYAGVAGFRMAAHEMKATYVVEMDADFSHHPRFIPAMLEAAEAGADVVVGSRLVRGGTEVGRTALRTFITLGANVYLRVMLGLGIRDCTTGFRVFRGDLLRRIPWDRVEAGGPAIVQEVLVACRCLGARIVEVPIVFEPRREGVSTFSAKIAWKGITNAWRLRRRGCGWVVGNDGKGGGRA